MFPIAFIMLLAHPAGAEARQESAALVRGARELLRDGDAAKAAILLRRARSGDSVQTEVDALFAQCQARLGGWVEADGLSGWIPGDDRLEAAARANPDSVHKTISRFLAAEDIAGAVRVAWALSRSHAADTAYLRTFRELRDRQEAKIGFHRDLAQKAQAKGDVSESLKQWRMAWAANPGDSALLDLVERAEQTWSLAFRTYRENFANALNARDESLAFELARRAKLLFPGQETFRKAFDSLDTLRRAARDARLDRINALADQGRDQEAMDAMEALVEDDPQEPALSLAQSALQARIQKRRKRAMVAELSHSFDAAAQAGDLSKAESVLGDLRRAGFEGPDYERLVHRIDSLRGTERIASAFAETMAAARASLKTGDLQAARIQLQKALSLQPGNAVAKGLLASIANSRPASPTASAPVIAARPEGGGSARERDAEKAKELLLAGVTAYRSGEYDRAIENWRRVLELDSGCVQAKKYLANVGLKQTRLK